jgi:hypothetical protein
VRLNSVSGTRKKKCLRKFVECLFSRVKEVKRRYRLRTFLSVQNAAVKSVCLSPVDREVQDLTRGQCFGRPSCCNYDNLQHESRGCLFYIRFSITLLNFTGTMQNLRIIHGHLLSNPFFVLRPSLYSVLIK